MNSSSTHIGAQHFAKIAQKSNTDLKNELGLVIGIGKGHEALFLKEILKSNIIEIDLQTHI